MGVEGFTVAQTWPTSPTQISLQIGDFCDELVARSHKRNTVIDPTVAFLEDASGWKTSVEALLRLPLSASVEATAEPFASASRSA